jgi:hypothetical protein
MKGFSSERTGGLMNVIVVGVDDSPGADIREHQADAEARLDESPDADLLVVGSRWSEAAPRSEGERIGSERLHDALSRAREQAMQAASRRRERERERR